MEMIDEPHPVEALEVLEALGRDPVCELDGGERGHPHAYARSLLYPTFITTGLGAHHRLMWRIDALSEGRPDDCNRREIDGAP